MMIFLCVLSRATLRNSSAVSSKVVILCPSGGCVADELLPFFVRPTIKVLVEPISTSGSSGMIGLAGGF